MENPDRRLLLGAAGLAGVAALASLAKAGPLSPPAGPVTATTKPLGEIEPRVAISDANTPGNATSRYRITRPGSYYLLDNILNVNGKHGIEIAASDVTLDLCGFELTMLPGSGTFDGVTVLAAGLTGLTVVNGSLRNWGRSAVNFSTFSATCCRVENIHAAGSGSAGLATGNQSIVRACTATASGGNGIIASFHSLISDCTATLNTFTGIAGNGDTTVERCAAYDNSTQGIVATSIIHSVANGNSGTGIYCGSQGVIAHCTANENATGIFGGVGAVITASSANANTSIGISINDGGSIIDCTAMDNALRNFSCEDGCLVRGCNAFATPSSPSQANFHVSGVGNRLEHNHAVGANRGFDVLAAGNILLSNTARANTLNYVAVAGNVCLVVSATLSAAVSGSTGGVSPGTTSPWANLAL